MNQLENEISGEELPLPDTQHELELLLDALNALNESLDHYLEAEKPVAA
jgi:hypothetical protein